MNIRVDLNYPIKDGTEVVFRSPVDCSQVTGLIVYYPGDGGNTTSKEFAFADAHGNNVGDIDHLFAENVVVKVILDDATSMAFVQNADTNAYLEGRFASIEGMIPPCIVCDASGSPIVLTDSSNSNLQGLNLYGKTTQNGTPSPSNPIPLESAGDSGSIGVTVLGKNLFDDVAWFERFGFTPQSDGSWLGKLVNEICFTNTAKQPGSMYLTATMKTDVNTTPFWMRAYYTDGTESETLRFWAADTFATKSITTDPKKTVDYIQWSWGQGGTYYIKDVQISFVDGEYESYKEPQTLSASTPNGLCGVPMPKNANDGFIYTSDYIDANGEARITDYIDFVRGVRVQRFKKVTVTQAYAIRKVVNGFGQFTVKLPADRKLGSYCLCSHYEVPIYHDGNDDSNPSRNAIIYKRISSDPRNVYAVHEGITTLEDYNAWLAENPLEFLYELAEPIETPLSDEELAQYSALHTNYPNTTVLNDGVAGMQLSYVADTKTYIDNKFIELQNAILATGANV